MRVFEVRKIYNKTALQYDELVTPCRISQFLVIIHELELKGDEKVLEVGSGPGSLSLEIGKVIQKGKVFGVDISERMVLHARKKVKDLGMKNVEFLVGDALNLDFPGKSFDVVVFSQVLHWISNPEKFLGEVKRVLKRSGKLGIISPTEGMYPELRGAFENLMNRYKDYYEMSGMREMIGVKIYSEKEIQELLSSAGFSIRKIFSMNFKESLTPKMYVRRIDAITNKKYLEPLPMELREGGRRELIREFLKLSRRDLKATESSLFVIAKKR